jgi:hypothetical protein
MKAFGCREMKDEREILQRTVRAIADRARDTYRLVEEAHTVDPRDGSGIAAAAKGLRMELLQTKGELDGDWGGCPSTASGTRGECIRSPESERSRGIGGHAEPSPVGHDPVV